MIESILLIGAGLLLLLGAGKIKFGRSARIIAKVVGDKAALIFTRIMGALILGVGLLTLK